MAAAPIKGSAAKFTQWGRENAQFLGVFLAGAAAAIATTGKVFTTITTLQDSLRHERELREKERELREVAVGKERELREVAVGKEREMREHDREQERELRQHDREKERELREVAVAKERELREAAVIKEREVREAAVETAVLRSQIELAERLQELTFSEEYRLWRQELSAKIGNMKE